MVVLVNLNDSYSGKCTTRDYCTGRERYWRLSLWRFEDEAPERGLSTGNRAEIGCVYQVTPSKDWTWSCTQEDGLLHFWSHILFGGGGGGGWARSFRGNLRQRGRYEELTTHWFRIDGKTPLPNTQCNGRNGEIREVYRKACWEVERSLILEVCREAEIGNLEEAEKEKCCPKTQMWVVILRSAVPVRWQENRETAMWTWPLLCWRATIPRPGEDTCFIGRKWVSGGRQPLETENWERR